MIAAHRRALEAMIGRVSQTITIGGTDYACARTVVAKERLRLDAGRLDQYQFSVVISANDIAEASLPATDTHATYEGTAYYILSYTLDGPGVGYVIHLGAD